MNIANHQRAVAQARDAEAEQCKRDVCPLCRKGMVPLKYADHEGYWHRRGTDEWSDWPCRASGIYERLARQAEANRG